MRIFSRWRKNPGKENGHLSEKVAEGTRIALPDVLIRRYSYDNNVSHPDILIAVAQAISELIKNKSDTTTKAKIENFLSKQFSDYFSSDPQMRGPMNRGTNQRFELSSDVPAELLPITVSINLVETSKQKILSFPYKAIITKDSNGYLLTLKYVGSNDGSLMTGIGAEVKNESDIHWQDPMPAPKSGY